MKKPQIIGAFFLCSQFLQVSILKTIETNYKTKMNIYETIILSSKNSNYQIRARFSGATYILFVGLMLNAS